MRYIIRFDLGEVRNSTIKPSKLELINEFTYVTGYEINVQKSFALLYTNNETTESEIKTVPFIIAAKVIKYLGKKLNQRVVKTCIWKLENTDERNSR